MPKIEISQPRLFSYLDSKGRDFVVKTKAIEVEEGELDSWFDPPTFTKEMSLLKPTKPTDPNDNEEVFASKFDRRNHLVNKWMSGNY